MTGSPVSLTQVEEARRNIKPVALRTPLVRCHADTPAEIYLKLENLQPIGSSGGNIDLDKFAEIVNSD